MFPCPQPPTFVVGAKEEPTELSVKQRMSSGAGNARPHNPKEKKMKSNMKNNLRNEANEAMKWRPQDAIEGVLIPAAYAAMGKTLWRWEAAVRYCEKDEGVYVVDDPNGEIAEFQEKFEEEIIFRASKRPGWIPSQEYIESLLREWLIKDTWNIRDTAKRRKAQNELRQWRRECKRRVWGDRLLTRRPGHFLEMAETRRELAGYENFIERDYRAALIERGEEERQQEWIHAQALRLGLCHAE